MEKFEYFEINRRRVLRSRAEGVNDALDTENYAYLLIEGKIVEFDFCQKTEEDELTSEEMAVFFGRVTPEAQRKIDFRNEVKEIGRTYGKYLKSFEPGAFFNFNSISKDEELGHSSSIFIAFEKSTLIKISKKNYKEFFETRLLRRRRKYHFLVKEIFPGVNDSSDSFLAYKKMRLNLIRLNYRKGDRILSEHGRLSSLYILTKGSLKMTKNLDTEKLDKLLQELKRKLRKGDELSLRDKQNVIMLKKMIKNLRLKLRDIKVQKSVNIAILTGRDLFGEESLSFAESDKISIFDIEALEDSEVYSLDADMLEEFLPPRYYEKLFNIFQKKLEIRMEKFNKETPPLLKDFERRVKETNYSSISDIFGAVNKSEKNNILKNFLRTKVEDENASYLRLPKSQSAMDKIHKKIKASGRLRQVLRFKKEDYMLQKKSKEVFKGLLQREKMRKIEENMILNNGIFSSAKNMNRYRVSNSKRISKQGSLNTLKPILNSY